MVKLGRSVKKEEGGAKEKAGLTGRDGGSYARLFITGPCGKTKSTTKMDVAAAATRRMRIRRRRIRKGERSTRRTTPPLTYTPWNS